MMWFFSVRKATLRFNYSYQYYIHGGLHGRFYHVSSNIVWSGSHQLLPSWLFSGHYYSSSTIRHATESSNRLMDHNMHEHNSKKVDLEIVSREIIKPASPTPQNLKLFNLSLIDQVMYDCYVPLILFLPHSKNASVKDVIIQRTKHLKETLSEILTRFYPLAGEVKDNLHIECNDKGVYYIEARVKQTLEEFLQLPNDQKLRQLSPETRLTAESSIGNYVIFVQVNIFNCGGIGLCTSMTHKLIDGHSYFTFMKAWAAAARGSTKIISPSFLASEVLLSNPQIKLSAPSKLMTTNPLSTKRFVFDSEALSMLKAQELASAPRGPTRMEAATALIWKVAAKVASTVRPFGPQSPHVLLPVVNLRNRMSLPFPEGSVGNIFVLACSICFPESELHLPALMDKLSKAIGNIKLDRIESVLGENGLERYMDILRNMNHLTDITKEGDVMLATSLLRSGVYELDFGWGKPVWFCYINPGFTRVVALIDTRKSGGVEASVTLSPDEMEIFERDPELLSYANVDPSPLQFLNN